MPQHALQNILTEAGLAIAPLRTINTPDKAVAFFRQLGYEIPGGAFGGSLQALATHAGELIAAVRQLAGASGDAAVISAIINILARLIATIDAIKQLHSAIQAGGGGGLPHIGDLPRRLTDFLVLDYLARQKTQAHEVLLLLGLIEHEPTPAASQPQRLINWERLGDVFTDPAKIVNDTYQWSTDFDTPKFLGRLERMMRAAGLPGGMYPQADTTRTILGNTATDLQELRCPIFQKGFTPETYSQFGIAFSPAEAHGGKKKGLGLLPYIMGAASFDFDVCDRGELVFESNADIKGVGLVVRPPFDAEGILNLSGAFNANIRIREKADRAQEIILIGSPGGSRLALQGLGARWFAANPQGKLDLGVSGEIQALRIVVQGGEGDGFLQRILSGIHVEAEAGMEIGASLLGGVTFSGGAKLAIELPTHVDLGPIHLNSMRLAVAPKAQDADGPTRIEIEAGVVIRAELGPLQGVVENIGLKAKLGFVPGNLGPANLDIAFKPPNGIGLSVDAGIVKGGGYLFIDPDRGEYAGALELTFSGIVSLKAIGIITTKMPDGQPGFSLLIIITAEFGAGIQLGFGFTLLGVGGLLGLNRTMNLQALADGVRTGTVNSIMFPQDVVANAPKIISDLRAVFPPREGTFLIGPMAKLGWGTPTLVSLSLGIIIEIPGNIAIVGVLKLALPTDDAALIVIQVAFVGAIEFDKDRLWFYAVLFESRIVFMTLEGEMGLLVAWGDDANFVISVGGFHPSFSPPPLPFPSPRRISVSMANTPVYRIRIECYFAVTSNTVQFGARAELFFGLDEINVQGHIAFDALFQFSPFYFIIEISASLSVNVFGAGLFSVSVRGSLDGPSPYHIKGHGSISLLFWDIDVDFEETWGESRDTKLPPIPILPILEAELKKNENWQAQLPAGVNLLVSLRKMPAEEAALILHPLGILHISQRALPLQLKLDKVGTQAPNDVNKLSLVVTGGGLARKQDALERFAPAQFRNFSDADKLSKPPFEKEVSGLDLSSAGADLRSSGMVKRVVRYEEIIIDSNFKRFARRFRDYIGVLFNHFLNGAAVTRCEMSKAAKKKLVPFDDKIGVVNETYTVAFQANNKAFAAEATTFHSASSAQDYMNGRIAADPTLVDTIHVIPSYEKAA
jgi:hypothetical protein